MGSPLGSALANIFKCTFYSRWLRDCPNDFKAVFYRRYVDDIFALFCFPDHAYKFKEYLSFKYCNIHLSIDKEKNEWLFKILIFFVKTRNLLLVSIEKRP